MTEHHQPSHEIILTPFGGLWDAAADGDVVEGTAGGPVATAALAKELRPRRFSFLRGCCGGHCRQSRGHGCSCKSASHPSSPSSASSSPSPGPRQALEYLNRREADAVPGIYVGGGHVIHFTRTGVDKTCLDSFRLEGKKLHSLRSYAYGRPLLEYWLTRSGTRTALPDTKPPEEVVNKAWELHEGDSFGEYNLFNNNCEHFATFCKTGNRASAQTALINTFELKAKGVKDWAIKIRQGIKAQVSQEHVQLAFPHLSPR
ncbi:hypothetical protein NL676_020376 [Syzygium grande]|nr:hypothetical protein NL676_020376 [Syzygium grande]